MLLTSTQTDSRLAVMSEVEKLVMLAREAVADPFAEAKAGFESDGIEVDRQSGAWVLRGSFRNTMRVAARGATEFADGRGCGGRGDRRCAEHRDAPARPGPDHGRLDGTTVADHVRATPDDTGLAVRGR